MRREYSVVAAADKSALDVPATQQLRAEMQPADT